MIFIDLEKAYGWAPKDLVWWVLNKRSALRGYIKIINDMYEGLVMGVRTTCRGVSEFSVTICLH